MLRALSRLRGSRWISLLAINVATLPAPLDTGLVSIILPGITRDLQAHITIASWVPLIYLIVLASFMPMMGSLSDNYGRKKMFIIGLIVFAAGAYLSSSSLSIYELLLARIVQALGGSLILSNSRALIVDVFGEGKSGVAMGLHVATIYVALMLGPLLGGVLLTLTSIVGWRYVFLLNVPLCLTAAALIALTMREERAGMGSSSYRIDWLGGVLLFAGLGLSISGVTIAPLHKGVIEVFVEEVRLPALNIYFRPFFYFYIPSWLVVASGLLALLAFFLREARFGEAQLFPLRLFKGNPALFSANITVLLLYSAHHSIWIVMPFYLTVVRALDPIEAGALLAIFPLTVMASSPLGGFISERVGYEHLVAMGLGVASIGLVLMSQLSQYSSTFYIVAALVFLGLGVGLFAAPNTNYALTAAPLSIRAQINGVLGMMRHIGQSLSIAFSALIIDLYIGYTVFLEGGLITISSFMAGVSLSFMIGALLALSASALALYVGRNTHKLR